MILCLTVINLGCGSREINTDQDEKFILSTIDTWDKAWEEKDVQMAIKHYDDHIDWTNAFGDRVQNKKDLKELLEIIFALDFVMAGDTEYVSNDLKFLTYDIALLRSKSIRKNQEFSDGTVMNDRHINQLRVYERKNGEWKIISHMISQAHEKK